ncbi:MAG: FAD-binding oxidoreductase [Alphaproteobacteria bacterium]
MATTEHAPSWYAATANDRTRYPPLDGHCSVDACVIGGGYTGLSAALHLAEAGFSVRLLEGRRVGWGASGRNGGQLGSGQRKDQEALEAMVGADRARALWDLAEAAKAAVRDRIARHAIACDYRPGVMTVAHKPALTGELHAYADHLAGRYGYDAIECLDPASVRQRLGSVRYHGGIVDTGAGHLHPLNYALGLARAARTAGAVLHEGTSATAVAGGNRPRVATASGTVRCRFVVVACNGYLDRLVPRLMGAIMPINNYIVATAPLGEAAARALIRDNVAVTDTKFVVNYFRLSADRRLLFGGGETYSRRFPADIAAFVRPHLLKVFPQLAGTPVDFGWGGTLAVTPNRMPSFGRADGNVFHAQGFSGHGVALTTLAGALIAEAAAGTMARFDVLAGVPQPRFPGGALLRWPALVAGMLWYSLRDRL